MRLAGAHLTPDYNGEALRQHIINTSTKCESSYRLFLLRVLGAAMPRPRAAARAPLPHKRLRLLLPTPDAPAAAPLATATYPAALGLAAPAAVLV